MKNHLGVFTPCRSCTHFSATGGQAADLGPSVHWSLVELKDPMSSAAFPWTTGCSWCYSWGRSASSSSADKQPTCTDPIKHFELSKWPKWDHSKTTWMLCFERASNESRSHLRHLFQPGGLCRLHLLDPRWILDGVFNKSSKGPLSFHESLDLWKWFVGDKACLNFCGVGRGQVNTGFKDPKSRLFACDSPSYSKSFGLKFGAVLKGLWDVEDSTLSVGSPLRGCWGRNLW